MLHSDNAVWAVQNIKPIVKHARGNPYERARFLAFLVHIVGDMHQPLHAATLISPQFPKGDRGGNLYKIIHQGKSMALHRFWDEGGGIFIGDESVATVNEIAAKITTLYPPSFFSEAIKDHDPSHWAIESFEQAKTKAYQTPINQPVNEDYIKQSQAIAAKQIALAGYRLSALLNLLLKG